MNRPRYLQPSFSQRHPMSLVILALTPITVSLSLASVANAQDKVTTSQVDRPTTAQADEATASSTENDARSSVESDQTAESNASVKQLSVAPLDVVEYPDDRPSWIENDGDVKSDTHTQVAVSQPSETEKESQASLELMKRIAVQLYANKLLLSDGHADSFVLREDWIADNVDRFVSREYSGTLHQGDMELYEHAAELRFPPEARNEIRSQWKNAEVQHRLGMLGFIVFVGTVLTGCGSAALGVFSRRVERKNASV